MHDHYWKRNGQWYVQVRKGKEHMLAANTAFDSVVPGVGACLDKVWDKLNS
ncbi:MAG: hypothetical protein HC820_05300 [Hydrococcus sp. RM1_1_31]|nr:hypothetical protein [Hydrococcus sp. RM1_1_31]